LIEGCLKTPYRLTVCADLNVSALQPSRPGRAPHRRLRATAQEGTPSRQDPNAAAALQELLGGKYGEMSTLANYMFQSFNFRSKDKLRPFYNLVASITAEELGHVELVSNGVAMLANGPDNDGDEGDGGDISDAPFEGMKDVRLAAAFLSNGGGATPVNSNGSPWNNDFVTTTGNVVTDLLHNFHLECGARLHKLRVYETLSDPTGREVCGYLLVRGSVHAHAYALALKKITGVAIEKMLPTPNINLSNIPECQKYRVLTEAVTEKALNALDGIAANDPKQ
jgi:Mn-containing catalase